MALEEWFTREAIKELWKNKGQIWSKISTWFTKEDDPRKILVIGPGGVGKTTLGHFLAGPPAPEDAVQLTEYIESIKVEIYEIRDNPEVQIVIPPGQPKRMDSTWPQILEEVKNGEFRGIVLVLAYGHHAIGDFSYKNHKLYSEEEGLEGFLNKYLAACQKAEEKVLEKLCDAIQKCHRTIWLLTLVTKQDLWWNERGAVENHYSVGKYRNIVTKCTGSKQLHEFRHEIAFVSLVIRNLVTGRDETLKSTVGGYDQSDQQKSMESLLHKLEGLMDWEKQHGD